MHKTQSWLLSFNG